MNVHAVINDPLVNLGTIEEWALTRGHRITTTAAYNKERYPEVEEFDMLIILGGRMGAYEETEYPWLRIEKSFIKKIIESNKPVLGICLGAQLIAEVIGGKVSPHKYLEIGWWKVNFKKGVENIPLFKNLPNEIKAFQYHKDSFELPDEAICLAENQACKNQAFIYKDNVVGIQFHLEFDEGKIQRIGALFNESKITPGIFVQKPKEFLNKREYNKQSKNFLYKLLDNIVDLSV